MTCYVHDSVVVDLDPYFIDDMCAAADHSFDEFAVTALGVEINSKTIMSEDTFIVECTVEETSGCDFKEEVCVCTYVSSV